MEKLAVTLCAASIVRVTGFWAEVTAPVQLLKAKPWFALAVSVTTVPAS